MSDGATPPINQPFDASTGRSISAVNWFSKQGYPHRASTRVIPLVCGEAAFSAVGKALRAANHSINMAFWGLDPAMLLERGTKDNYDTDNILGEILLKKAQSGVQVRIIVWDSYSVGIGSGGSGETDLLDADTGGNNTNLKFFYDLAKTTPRLEIKMTNAYSGLTALGSYHQKIITVDVETPAKATAFVMGHNMLVPYWSTKALIPNQPRRQFALKITGKGNGSVDLPDIAALERSIANTEQDIANLPKFIGDDPGELEFRTREYQNSIAQTRAEIEQAKQQYARKSGSSFLKYEAIPASQLKPYLDISTQIYGGGVVDVYNNFERVWKLNGGTIYPQSSSLYPAAFGDASSNKTTEAQMGATFDKAGEDAIADFYFNAISNANRYVLILNQYFRYWGMSERIVEAWKERDIPDQKKVPIYVVTNDFNVSTSQRGHDGETLKIFTDAKIPISLCKMATRENIGRKEIYVHAKLLIVDDVFYTIGSANYNYRSLKGDPEFNVAVVDPRQAQGLRREIMNMLIGNPMNDMMHGDPMDAFTSWEKGVKENTAAHSDGDTLPNGRVIHYEAATNNIPFTNWVVQNDQNPGGQNHVA